MSRIRDVTGAGLFGVLRWLSGESFRVRACVTAADAAVTAVVGADARVTVVAGGDAALTVVTVADEVCT